MKSNPLEHYFDNTCKIQSSSLKEKLFKFEFKSKTCEVCGIEEWQNKPAPLELHHINGNSQDNALENLQILCPNCHAQTSNYRAGNQKRVVIKKTVEEIKEAIVSSCNSRQALIKLGYAPQGGNYQRINEIKRRFNLEFRPMTEEEKLKQKETRQITLNKRWQAAREEAAKNGNFKLPPTSKKYFSKEEYWEKSRKVARPTKEELLNLVWQNSLSSVAKNLGVSDNTVRKWAKFYQIPVPPVGYWAKYYNGHTDICKQIKDDLFISFGLI